MKTMAEHARAYRTRKAEKMARYEEALNKIAEMQPFSDPSDAAAIAWRALNQK